MEAEKMITTMTERGLRQAAARKGFYLSKGMYHGLKGYWGYMLSDANRIIVAGNNFDLSLKDVKDFLNNEQN